MHFRKPLTPVLVSAALVLTATAGIGAVSRLSRTSAATHYQGNAKRFLELTAGGARPADAGGKPNGGSPATTDRDGPGGGNFTPAGWRVRPAGTQVPTFNFPLGLAKTPDGTSVLVSSDSGGMQGITSIDPSSLNAIPVPAANLFMGLAATDTGTLYASGGNADRVFRYKLVNGIPVATDATEAVPFPTHHTVDGVLTSIPGAPHPLPAADGISVPGYPGNSVLDGRYLYVAGTLSEPSGSGADACPSAQSACGRVTVIDTSSDTVVRRVPVGLDAYGLAVDSARHRLYVSNWADEAGRGGASGGTVSVVDITDPVHAAEVATQGVGHHPTAVQLSSDRTRLFVTNTNDDTISILDVSGTGAPGVVRTESVRPLQGVPVGAYPEALALSPDGGTLFVALAGLNAVEILDGHTGARVAGKPMYIPTGWYPSALLVTGTASHYRLWVANAKGAGAATKSTGLNASVGQEGPPLDGTVSVIDLPTPAKTANDWTNQVFDNDHFARVKVDPCAPGGGIHVSQVLCPPKGKTSPVKHVVYIVTENKTFDQYFGDLAGGNYDANPGYLLYGQPVTPNHHALADKYSLSDRFYSDAQVSVTGHSWASGATATDHNEKTWPADYDQGIRGTHGNGDALKPSVSGAPGGQIQAAEDELFDPEGGFIFEAFKRAGAVPPAQAGPGKLSMAIYGEHTARESGNMDAYKAPHWKDGDIQYFDTCRADQFVTGAAPNGPFPDNDDHVGDCAGRTLPGEFNLAHWSDVLAKTGQDTMPSFIYMSLPVNHTLGTNLGNPTPASMVADNDHAIGQIIDGLSHSKFWESTVVMQTEDDTQAAGDHVSPLRDYLQVSGPWAKPGANHQWGSMPSLLRTIEQIFNVEPISLYDKLAYPQHGAFRASLGDKPDTSPYTVINPVVPYAVNQIGAPGQAESMAMDWNGVDHIDMGVLNAILYADARGAPYSAPAR